MCFNLRSLNLCSCNTVPLLHWNCLFRHEEVRITLCLSLFQDGKPIYSFEDNSDYVLDVAWSPMHPALFAAVDGGGRLDLWNLNQDTEVPAASVMVEGNPALNRVSWTPSGLHVTVGDNLGKIWVYDVAEVSVIFFATLYALSVRFLEFCASETRRMEQVRVHHSRAT